SPRRADRRRRGLHRVGSDGSPRRPQRGPPPVGRGAARPAAHDGARLAPRLRHAARGEGVPAYERELRALPVALARAARAREEARDGRARARRPRAVGGERPGDDGDGEPAVGGVTTGRPAPVVAVIDIGSNSVLLLVVSLESGARWRVVDRALATTRLGHGLEPGGALDPGARARTLDTAVAFAARARAGGATHVWGFGTGAARDAAGGAGFVDDVARAAGMPVEVLSGDREARLAYDAARLGLGLGGPLLVVDVGGRTTELALGTDDHLATTASLPLGAL